MFNAKKVVEETITMAKAEQMLMNELGYTKERAHLAIKHLDKSGDGKLSGKELERFKQNIKQSKKELTDAFTALDQQHIGYITINLAMNFLQQAPFFFPAEKCKALLSKFDKDGNGKLFYNEFITFYVEAKETYQTIATYFAQLDADGNGSLSPDELIVAIMNSTGLDEPLAREFIAQFDVDGNGSIDKSEFMSMWTLMFG